MADISKCSNNHCSSKLVCYRYMVKAQKYQQSYTSWSLEVNSTKCMGFIVILPTDPFKSRKYKNDGSNLKP